MIITYLPEYRMRDTSDRCLWISYLLIVTLSSLVGDTIILIASVRYNAINLNKFIVVVMQHIAVCDLLQSVSFVLPTIISLIADEWILGYFSGYPISFLNSISFPASSILVCILTSSKLLLLKLPLRTGLWTKRNAHFICTFFWFILIVLIGLVIIFGDHKIMFNYVSYNVAIALSLEWANKLIMLVGISSIIPTFLVMFTSVLILHHLFKSRRAAKRSGGKLRCQGILTVLATATVSCASFIPYVLFYSRLLTGLDDIDMVFFTRISISCSALNIMSNFYIYNLTIRSFRRFVKMRLVSMLLFLKVF